jgi:hypothetical protein
MKAARSMGQGDFLESEAEGQGGIRDAVDGCANGIRDAMRSRKALRDNAPDPHNDVSILETTKAAALSEKRSR